MARVHGCAKCRSGEWSIQFKSGVDRRLRTGGYYAGYSSSEKLYLALDKKGPKGFAPLVPEDDLEGRGYCFRDEVRGVSSSAGLKSGQTSSRTIIQDVAGHGDHELDDQDSVVEGYVDDFCLLEEKKPVSILHLPVWIDGVVTGGLGLNGVHLLGKCEEGLRTVQFPVDMWKLQIHGDSRPCFFVRNHKGRWIRLKKPRVQYTGLMNEAWIVAHFLQFVKNFPNSTLRETRQHLKKECRLGEGSRSLGQLSKYGAIVKSFIDEDEEVRCASVVATVFPELFGGDFVMVRKSYPVVDTMPRESSGAAAKIEESPMTRKRKAEGKYESPIHQLHQEKKQAALEGNDDIVRGEENQTEDEELDDPPICVICDDGGDIVFCEGICKRHFHACKVPQITCMSLGFTDEQIKTMGKFICQNCLLKQHQCFACGLLGFSSHDSEQKDLQQVYMCSVPSCQRFYHNLCAAQLLVARPAQKILAENFDKGLDKLICPRHRCVVCLQMNVIAGELVQCRRCPKAWHKACLMNFAKSGEDPTRTVWRHNERDFIYCRAHDILPHLLAPPQDHLLFPSPPLPLPLPKKPSRFKRKAHRTLALLQDDFSDLSSFHN